MRNRLALFALMIAPSLLASGCAVQQGDFNASPVEALPPRADRLYRHDDPQPGTLAYAPDRVPFAPLLTKPFAYPTQAQANNAWRRALAEQEPEAAYSGAIAVPQRKESTGALLPSGVPTAIRLFGCAPGALDSQTARVIRYPGPVVHCATDFLDGGGEQLSRETVNFYFYRKAWRMTITDPPRAPVAWRVYEGSPSNAWWWVPGRDRYQ